MWDLCCRRAFHFPSSSSSSPPSSPLRPLPGGCFHGSACVSGSVKDVAASCLLHGRLPALHPIFPSALVFLVNFHLSLPFLPPPSVYLLMNCVPGAWFFFFFWFCIVLSFRSCLSEPTCVFWVWYFFLFWGNVLLFCFFWVFFLVFLFLDEDREVLNLTPAPWHSATKVGGSGAAPSSPDGVCPVRQRCRL